MNYLKTDILKKDFRNFVNKILPAVSECGSCETYSCKWHKIHLLTCNQCRDARCSACVMFKSAVEMLIKSLDDDGLNSFENFVTDSLGMGDISIKRFLEKKKNMKPKKEKKTFDIKFYHKSEKK